MGAGGWTPHPRPSGALYSVRDIWSLPEPLQGFSLAGEGSRYLGSKSLLRREHERLPILCTTMEAMRAGREKGYFSIQGLSGS